MNGRSDLELVVSTPTQTITVPLDGPIWLGSGLDVDARFPELAPRHAVVEPVDRASAVARTLTPHPIQMSSQGRSAPSATLTLGGPSVELGGIRLRLSGLAHTPPPRPRSNAWAASVVDTQRLTAVRELGDETATRVFQALHSLGSLGRQATAPTALLSPAAQVLLDSTRACQAGVLWRPDPTSPWARALRTTGRWSDEVQLDPFLIDRVADSCSALATVTDDGPRAYLSLRAPAADHPSGAIFLGREPGGPAFTSFDLELATLIGRNLVIMLDRARALTLLRAQAQDLEDSHRRLSGVVDALAEGIVLIRRDGAVDLVNQVARSLFEDTHPRHESTVVRTFSIADLLEAAFAGGPTVRRDVNTAAGRTFEVSASPIVATGNQTGVKDAVVVLRDVTEERERARALQDSERLRALGEAMATVAHELNNPLTAVVGFAALASQRAPDELRDQCQRISEQATRCLSIVRDVLGAARGGRKERGVTFDIHELARRATEPLAAELSRWQIEVKLEGAACLVTGDPQRVHQVLTNLLCNAVEALAENVCGQRVITISVEAGAERCHTRITDTGPGVPPEVRERLFKPFTTTRGAGTGLGLSVSATIVREHGGTLTCRSEPGNTQFAFDLQLAREGAVAESRSATGGIVRPCRALVADDEEPIRTMLAQFLTHEGHVVELATDGQAALRRLLEDPGFDIVLLDLHMPGTTGIELLERLAAAGSPLLARCYVMTGEVDEAVLESAQRLAAGVLLKPFTLSDVRRTIRWSMLGESPGA